MLESTSGLLNKEKIIEFKHSGFNICIDDFGKGYTSFRHFQDIPIDLLKIDISFIRDIDVNNVNLSITSSIITLAKNLKIPVVAEGVENYNQLKLLSQKECDYMQGFLLSKPVSGEEMTIILEKENSGKGIGRELSKHI